MNSSFSSISFEAETVKRFKELSKQYNKTNTELLNQMIIDSIKINNKEMGWQEWFVKSAAWNWITDIISKLGVVIIAILLEFL